jgi:hypothetical protein
MDILRAFTSRKTAGGQPPRNNQVLNPGSDPGLPNLTQLPTEVLGLVLHEFSAAAPATYVRTIRNFSLVSRDCREAAAAYVKNAGSGYQAAAWIAQEKKLKPIEAAVRAAAHSGQKSFSYDGIKVKKTPPNKLIKIFKSNPVVRIFLPKDPDSDAVSVGLPRWSSMLPVRCLQFDGLTLACAAADTPSMARKELADKLDFLARQLPLIKTCGDHAQMRFEIFLKGDDANSNPSAADCIAMVLASQNFLDVVATAPVTKLHLENFTLPMLTLRLGEMRQLERLVLQGNDINDERAIALVQATKNLPRLVFIDLRRNPLTREGINRLGECIADYSGGVTLLTD